MVLYYFVIGSSVPTLLKYDPDFCPNVGDIIIDGGMKYKVMHREFDYDGDQVTLEVDPNVITSTSETSSDKVMSKNGIMVDSDVYGYLQSGQKLMAVKEYFQRYKDKIGLKEAKDFIDSIEV